MAVYRDVEVSLFRKGPNSDEFNEIKKTYTIVFDELNESNPVRSEEEQVESFLKKIYNWQKGLQYDYLTIKTLNTTNTMAKKTIETAETVDNKLSVFEEKAKAITLPEIPKVINIGGVDFSEENIKKAVDTIKKIKVDVPKPTDTVEVAEQKKKVYEDLVEKKNQFVKTRTGADKFRTEITGPLNAWAKKLKEQTDKFGEIAKEGQSHCESEIYIWENWQEEQERIKREAVQKLVNERTVELQKVSGVMNPASLHWTFEHNPSKIVEHLFLQEADDSDWNGLMKELEDSFEKEKAAKIAKEAEFEATKTALFNTRVQMLQLAGGYEPTTDGGYQKNGHTLTIDQIKNTLESDWFPLIMSHNVVKEVVNPFATTSAPVETTQPQQEVGASHSEEFVFNPFKAFEVKEDTQVSVTPETSSNPFESVNNASTNEDVVTTSWNGIKYVETSLQKSILRVFPEQFQAEAMEGIHEVKFDGRFDENGLMYIIYVK